MDKPQIIAHVQKSLNYTIFDSLWIPSSAKFVTLGNYARGSGALQIYELSGGDVDLIKEIEKSSAFKCGTFGASRGQDRHLATGNFEGRVQIWDLESPDIPVYSSKAHSQIINAIDGVGGLDIGSGAPEIVTGSRDGSVKVWDSRQKNDPVVEISPEDGEQTRDCWAVAFGNSYSNTERCVCAGYDNGDVKLFDLRTMAPVWDTNLKNGVCSVEFDRKDIQMNKLVCTTLEQKIFVFDMRTHHPSKGFAQLSQKSHKSTIWCVRHLPQNRDVFVTTGGGGTVHLWQYEYPASRVSKEEDGSEVGVVGSLNLLQNVGISTQPISSFDWHPGKLGLAVCSGFDQTVRLLIVTKLNRL